MDTLSHIKISILNFQSTKLDDNQNIKHIVTVLHTKLDYNLKKNYTLGYQQQLTTIYIQSKFNLIHFHIMLAAEFSLDPIAKALLSCI